MNLAEFHFIRPLWLIALPAGIMLAWWLWRRSSGASNWQAICDQQLLQHLLINVAGARSRVPFFLFAVAWVVATLAMAGPSWERQLQPVFSNIQGRVIVLDVSRSMDAVDLKPSRLALARFKAADILRQPYDGQYALVVFAGDAFTVSPLTDDADTLLNMLPALDTNVVPVQGSRADLGLQMGGALLQQTGIKQGELILITDGVNEQTKTQATELLSQGYRTNVMAVGTKTGGPISLPDGGFLKDQAGNIVLPGVEHTKLQQIAQTGGGVYVELQSDDSDIETLLANEAIDSFTLEVKQTELTSELWLDQGPWLVLFLLPFAAIAFRRGWLLVLPLTLVFILPPEPAQAFSWDELWLRPDQRAAKAFAQGDMETAAGIEQDPQWQGSAQYRTNDFNAAEQTFSKVESASSYYNRGNALAKQNKLQESLGAYETALKLDPEMKDAQHNLRVVKEALEKQQQQEQSQSSNESESGRTDENSSEADDAQDSESEQQPSSKSQSRPSSSTQQQAEQRADEESESQPSPESDQQQDEAQANDQQDQDEQSKEQPAREGDEKTDQQLAQMETDNDTDTESDQALEQWLRRIPDDPGGLLRRKFKYQYQQREKASNSSEQQW
ncbi:MAG: VWA domain-containing protein [Gammaproteobacteria bacterium]|nr:VWA domain-containing protein [Gammaproteobacteria bacterium]